MKYTFEIQWSPKEMFSIVESVNKTMREFGFGNEEVVVTYSIGTHTITSSVVIPSEILTKYKSEATKLFEEKLGGKIYLKEV